MFVFMSVFPELSAPMSGDSASVAPRLAEAET